VRQAGQRGPVYNRQFVRILDIQSLNQQETRSIVRYLWFSTKQLGILCTCNIPAAFHTRRAPGSRGARRRLPNRRMAHDLLLAHRVVALFSEQKVSFDATELARMSDCTEQVLGFVVGRERGLNGVTGAIAGAEISCRILPLGQHRRGAKRGGLGLGSLEGQAKAPAPTLAASAIDGMQRKCRT
jgi:hypothetical protein